MPVESLREFINKLDYLGLLKRIDVPVSSYLEITEIQSRVIREKGPALLFEDVRDKYGNSYDFPVLTNLFGTKERIALGIDRKTSQLREVGEMLAFLKNPQPPSNIKEAIKIFPVIKTAMTMKPKVVSKAACQEIILKDSDIDLNKLPIQTCWPNEPAPLITWPIVVTKGVGNDQRDKVNLGVYRMQVTSKNTTLMRWLKHRGGSEHYERWKKQKTEPLPAAIIIGADPGTILAAVTPIPENFSEYEFAGLLRGKKLSLIDCKTIPLQVPAESEIIIEGHVLLDNKEDEGPFGDHTGYYNSVEQFPVFKITAITMRKNPIYLSTYTGRPPDEPSIIGEALNEIFIPILKQQFSELIDFWLPPEGCSYRIAVISIKKEYPGQAKRIMMGIWSFLKQFMYTKFVIIVDEDINPRDWKDVMWAISTRMDPARDITVIENTPIDYLDFASPISGLGGKIGLDATNKIYPESSREWGKRIKMSEEIISLVSNKWKDLGL